MALITPGMLSGLTPTAATPQTTSLPTITIPTDIDPAAALSLIPAIDPAAALSLIPAAPCGLDVNMESLKGSIDALKSQISGLTSGAGGIADQLSSLGGDLADKVNGLADSLSSAIGEIKLPSLDLGSEISALLGDFGSGDPLGIADKIASIRESFPDFDVSGMLDKLSSGTFDPCTDVPNMKIIDGKVVEDAIAAVAPAIDAVKPPAPAASPTPKPSYSLYRFSFLWNIDRWNRIIGIGKAYGFTDTPEPGGIFSKPNPDMNYANLKISNNNKDFRDSIQKELLECRGDWENWKISTFGGSLRDGSPPRIWEPPKTVSAEAADSIRNIMVISWNELYPFLWTLPLMGFTPTGMLQAFNIVAKNLARNNTYKIIEGDGPEIQAILAGTAVYPPV